MANAWDAYIDSMNQQTQNHLKSGGIYGDNGAKWAGRGDEPTTEEVLHIRDCCAGNDEKLSHSQAHGVMIAGQKYRFIKHDKDEGTVDVCGKADGGKTLNGTLMKINTGVVICVTEEDGKSPNAHTGAAYIGQYLKNSGY